MFGLFVKTISVRKRWRRLSTKLTCFICLLLIIIILIIIYYQEYFFGYEYKLSYNHKAIYDYIAMIVDDRAIQSVVNVVINVAQHIPNDWKVQIITPYHNWPFYMNSTLAQLIHDNRVFLTPLEARRDSHVNSTDFINLILTSTALWYQVQGDKVLLFQIDSVLCSNATYKITDFLQYDFIGAPWHTGGCCNGGLSLRSRTKTLEMLESGRYPLKLGFVNEDGWYTYNLYDFNARMPSREVAMTFAVESMYYPQPFAVHKPLLEILGTDNMEKLCNQCPEAKGVFAVCQSSVNAEKSTITR